MKRSELVKVQNELIKEYPLFPEIECLPSVIKLFDEFNFQPKSGNIWIGKSNLMLPHNWNEDPFGNIVDLSFYQFQKFFDFYLDRIVFMPKFEAAHKYGYFENVEMTSRLNEFTKNKEYLPFVKFS